MTTRGPCIVVTLLGCVLAVAASAHAESAWMLWQQATVFTERWWIPNGWPAHWRTTEMTPVALSEFQTLADCQLAQMQAKSRRRSSKRSGGEGEIRHVRRQVRRQIRLRAIRLATTEDRAWRAVEVNSKRLVAVIVFSGILAFATSASAECAWVLWQRVDSFDARGALVSSPTSVGATYTTSAECITAIDKLERQWQSPQAVVMRDAQTILAVMFRDNNQTVTKALSFLCAPDTVDPRGANGK